MVQLYGPTMLDISTNSAQFGVFVQTIEHAVHQPAPPVSRLYLQAPASRLRIVALPQVEWEPVPTVDPTSQAPLTPNPFVFADSWPATQVGTNSVTLMPVSPHELVGGLVESWTAEDKSAIGAVFTAHFGIVSFAELRRIPSAHFISPSIQLAQPTFSSISFKGGDQLSLHAGRSLSGLPGPTSFLAGESMMIQILNSGSWTSILGPPSTYDRDFRNFVPIERVDLSGFGQSMFSEWRDETVELGTSQVDLEVIVGRAEREVVVQNMELVYCSTKVTQTVVIQSLNNGQMRRQVFLKPTGDGAFIFSDKNIKTHNGLVRRVTNIRNMHELNDASYIVENITFWPVRYDCDIQIAATPSSIPILVPARNHRGYLASLSQGAPDGTILQLGNYVGLLKVLPNKNLTPGGPIDCTVKVSNLTLKLTGIGV